MIFDLILLFRDVFHDGTTIHRLLLNYKLNGEKGIDHSSHLLISFQLQREEISKWNWEDSLIISMRLPLIACLYRYGRLGRVIDY